MICSQCPNATAVYLRGGMYYDCKSIRAMRARLRCNQHPPWQVQVYMDKIFVPRECPITNEGVKAKKRGSWSALYEATRNSYVEAACKVMGPAAEVVKPSFLEDALRWAVSFGHDEIIRVLLNWGADTNAKYSEFCPGRSALMIAAVNGHVEAARVLLNWGANLHATDDNGETALLIAAKQGLWDFMKLLEDYGADICKVGQNGMTALATAVFFEIERETRCSGQD